ncbi:MAG: hypothetical protein U1E39_00215 [Planctomycetota bacterium]
MPDTGPARHDLLTVVAVATVAYALDNVLHEGLGHGGVALLVGGKPQVLSSLHYQGVASDLSDAAVKAIAAGGSVVNALAGAFASWRERRAHGVARFFWWTFATVSLLQATGYLIFSGLTDFGDWAVVIHGWTPHAVFRWGMAAVGAGLYLWVVTHAMRGLVPFLGASRSRDGFRLTIPAYVTGALLYGLSGLLNPLGTFLLVVSGAAASLGGTSGLVWGPSMLGDPSFDSTAPKETISRSVPWIVAAAVAAAVFIGVLGPGIRLG